MQSHCLDINSINLFKYMNKLYIIYHIELFIALRIALQCVYNDITVVPTKSDSDVILCLQLLS